MADVFLIVATVVAFIILLIVGVYLLVYYQHPDDHNDAYFPKIIVILGFVLAGATVLMFPLDVANNEGYPGCAGYDTALCGGLNMDAMWSAIFWLVPIWTFLLVPFATFYYEADDGLLMAGTAYAPNAVKKSRIWQALMWELFIILIVAIIFVAAYFGLGKTYIPVQQYNGNGTTGNGIGKITPAGGKYYTVEPVFNDTMVNGTVVGNMPFQTYQLENMTAQDYTWIEDVTREAKMDSMELRVSVAIFYGGLMAWLGWFLFCVFGGIGLSALPLDLILCYRDRPKRLAPEEVVEITMSLRERTNELVDIGELIKLEREEKQQSGLASNWGTLSFDRDTRKAARDERQAMLGFKQAVYLLEEDVEDFLNITTNYDNFNPIIPYAALVCGCISVLISFLWFVHIVVYVLPKVPLAPFLNAYFAWFDKWFPLFGVLSVALFTAYLLIGALKGCFKFGLRFMFMQIHPMKLGKTYMSSFLFNIGLVLMCALPVVQFCQDAFSDYAAFSTIRQIYGVQVQNLLFFSFFWRNNVFPYAFVVFTVLTVLYLLCKPRDQSADPNALKDRLQSRKAGGTVSRPSSSADGGGRGSMSKQPSARPGGGDRSGF